MSCGSGVAAQRIGAQDQDELDEFEACALLLHVLGKFWDLETHTQLQLFREMVGDQHRSHWIRCWQRLQALHHASPWPCASAMPPTQFLSGMWGMTPEVIGCLRNNDSS